MPRELTSAASVLDALGMSEEPEQPAAQTSPAESGPPLAASSADVPPDHLAINPSSAHFNADLLQRGVGIRFKGVVRTNIEEYCISEGWVRVQAGKSMDRKGQPLTIKLSGVVEAWYEDLGENPPVAKA